MLNRGGTPSSGDRGAATTSANFVNKKETAAGLERRGYVVYRGVCTANSVAVATAGEGGGGVRKREGGGSRLLGELGLDSFQTWGPGLRFASVPLAGEERVSGL
ncbi:unnamed protein product [Laminaria digitata]